MNDFLIAVLLGVVEGVTEFLPVSSTAHLRIFQALLGISLEDEFWKLFAIFIQLGAILSIVVLYRKKLLHFFLEALKPSFYQKGLFALLSHPLGLIGIATLATCVPAFLLRKLIGHNLESLSIIAGALLLGGLVMILVDLFFSKGSVVQLEKIKPLQALLIGLVQVLSAVFPGTSRSMSTIASGQVLGLSRPIALEFSFLVSIPVMVVATLYDLLKYIKEGGGSSAMTSHQAGVLTIGFLVSFVVAYIVVAWFLAYVRKRGFLPFGLYRIVFGAALFFF